jgi:glycosyltransferase involved in cell wall biosynthesis
MNDFSPDILFGIEEPYSLQAALFLRWSMVRKVPFVFLSCQNIDRPLPSPFSHLERFVLTRSSGGWFLNEDALARARKRGFKAIGSVIPLGVEIERFTSPDITTKGKEGSAGELRPFTVGYVGRLVRGKGVEDLVRACAFAGVRLVAAGTGPEESRLRTLAVQLGVEAVWMGKVPSLQMADCYRQMDLLVLPSRTTHRWKEQFGRVLIEAMAAGVPLIGARTGEIPKVIGDAGWTCPEGDVEALAGLIRGMREDESARTALVRAGRERVAALYAWRQVAQHLDRLAGSVLGGRQRINNKPVEAVEGTADDG